MGFRRVSSKVHFPHLEEVLAFWRAHDVPRRVDEERRDARLYVLYEGSATANGSPGVRHVLARVFLPAPPGAPGTPPAQQRSPVQQAEEIAALVQLEERLLKGVR